MKRWRPSAGRAVAALVLFPLVPWLTAAPITPRLGGVAVLKSVANLAAFFGIAAWAVNLVLASRIRPIERAAGGPEALYRLHRRVGALVVAMAAVHALFLTLHAWGRNASGIDLYLPSAGWSVFTGVIALALLIGFVAASFARRLPYQAFLLVQRLLGATFVLGAVHAFAVRGTAASSPTLLAYVGCLTAAGCASLAYRLVGGRLGLARHTYTVREVNGLGDDVVEVVLVPVGPPLEFRAGQFVYATFHQEGIPREAHPFTIASAPGGTALRLAVKKLGDFTASVMTLQPGARAQLEGPFGSFFLSRESPYPQTWIAGGIGVTPFLSWARSLDLPVLADLYYCTPGKEQAHFLEELLQIADRYPTFRVIPMRKQTLGHLTAGDIEAVNPNASRGLVFVCGSAAMTRNLVSGFAALGASPERIHFESFDFRGDRRPARKEPESPSSTP